MKRSLGVVVTAASISSGAMVVAATPAAAVQCARPVTEVASGYGPLENLAFDGHGRMLLSQGSASGEGMIVTRTAHGRRGVLAASVKGPGGIVVHGTTAYVTAGNTFVSGVIGVNDGSIKAIDLNSRRARTVAAGLTMPNGLTRLPDGSFVVSRDLGDDTGLRLVSPGRRPLPIARGLQSTNGVAWDPANRRVVVSTTFSATTVIAAVDTPRRGKTARWKAIARIPGFGPANAADDLTVDEAGVVYATLNTAGRVVRVDPRHGTQCSVANNLPLVTSVRFGRGPGWNPTSLYATTMTGSVFEIHDVRAKVTRR